MIVYDVIGVGAGVFNLSLAAMLNESTNLSSLFLEKRNSLSWYPNLLFGHSRMQTHFLKDAIFLANPTSKHSFVYYLHDKNRLYRFLNKADSYASRAEFSDYMLWLSNRLPNVKLNSEVSCVEYSNRDKVFLIHVGNEIMYKAKNIVVGTGKKFTYGGFSKMKGCYLADEYLYNKQQIINSKSIAIVGGGKRGLKYSMMFCVAKEPMIVYLGHLGGTTS